MKETIKETRTNTSLIRLGSDHIFRITFLQNSTITIDTLKENEAAFIEMAEGKVYPFIFEAEDNVILTAEAQQHAVTMGSENMSVIAVVVNNFLYRLLAEFYYGKNKPPIPYKVFSSIEDAENWIRLYS